MKNVPIYEMNLVERRQCDASSSADEVSSTGLGLAISYSDDEDIRKMYKFCILLVAVAMP